MKQEERRQKTIELLLETTKGLIRAKGCHSITMKDIMDQSGLSKGAIFHYVKTKDELFTWVLLERLEETNKRFMDVVEQGGKTFEGPMQQIAERVQSLDDAQEVTNKVLIYLLGKEDQPTVAEALTRYYERSVQLAKQWIQTGQESGVIPLLVDAGQTAEMFCLMSLGFRVRATIPTAASAFTTQHYAAFMADQLNPRV